MHKLNAQLELVSVRVSNQGNLRISIHVLYGDVQVIYLRKSVMCHQNLCTLYEVACVYGRIL